MATYSFETKALKEYGNKFAKKAERAAKDIIPTPFPMEYEYAEKDVYQQLDELNIEAHFRKTNIKNKFSIITELYSTLLPTWNWSAALIAGYIIKHLYYNSNIIRITEEDFKSYSGMSGRSFYEGLNSILRPECPTICAGDSIKLLARTTKKSVYVVNHNIIFKGRLDRFVEMYKDKFPNPCEIDSKGKIVLKN